MCARRLLRSICLSKAIERSYVFEHLSLSVIPGNVMVMSSTTILVDLSHLIRAKSLNNI